MKLQGLPQIINLGNKMEIKWNELIDAIIDGKVIPVIGPDFLAEIKKGDGEDEKYEAINLHQVIIDAIAQYCGVESKPKTFSQLVYDKKYIFETNSDKDVIYTLIPQVMEQLGGVMRPNALLKKLLSLRKFPFVITTSFTPMVEQVMKEAWPDKDVRVLQFRNDPKNDLAVGEGDIESEMDLERPTVYYMFGKQCYEKRYVVTDMDMMNFCRRWIAGGSNVPRVLTEVIKKRYLLILGNNYSDWLFRFIWFSLRPTTDVMRSSMMVHDSFEPTLYEFLDRLQTFIEKDPTKVVKEIERRVLERKTKERTVNNGYETDVFLSYSRRDKDFVDKLRNALTAKGVRVWYDVNDIPGGLDWRDRINNGIRKTRLFIPVLTRTITKEYMEVHEYREEWILAAEMARKMGGREFIWPLAEKGFDFYKEENKLPVEFKDKNANWFAIADDFDAFASEVKNRVDELKQKEEALKNGK